MPSNPQSVTGMTVRVSLAASLDSAADASWRALHRLRCSSPTGNRSSIACGAIEGLEPARTASPLRSDRVRRAQCRPQSSLPATKQAAALAAVHGLLRFSQFIPVIPGVSASRNGSDLLGQFAGQYIRYGLLDSQRFPASSTFYSPFRLDLIPMGSIRIPPSR